MENQRQLKQILFFVLLAMVALSLLLAAVNAFLVWQLFLTPPPTAMVDTSLQEPTLTESNLPEQPLVLEETTTPQPAEADVELVEQDETPVPVTEEFVYQVVAGDSLIMIANEQEAGIQDIKRRNQMYGDLVIMRQGLIIPRGPQPTFDLVLAPSVKDGLYTHTYRPDTIDEDSFVLWLNENDYAFLAREPLYYEIENARVNAENIFGSEFDSEFGVYVAGSPFEDNPALRSFVTPEGEVFILYDGAGDVTDVGFHISYALAKAWLVQMWGESPQSFVAEGMALAAADRRAARSERLSLCDITKAYSDADLLPAINGGDLPVEELLFDYVTNSLAGCFADYLLDTYEPEELRVLYQSGDFAAESGDTWQVEEESFQRWLDKYSPAHLIETEAYTAAFDQLTAMNRIFFPDFLAYGDQTLSIYYSLDQARLGLLRNDPTAAEFYLANAEVLLTLDDASGEKPAPTATRTIIVIPTAFPTLKPADP